MTLRDRLTRTLRPAAQTAAEFRPPVVVQAEARPPRDAYQELKSRIHRRLVESLDLSNLSRIPHEVLASEITRAVEGLVQAETAPLSQMERERLIVEVLHETLGLGPLEPLMHDPQISDILVNGPRQVYVERFGKLEPVDVVFKDDAHLMQIIDRIVAGVGRRVDEASPMVDARLPDGSRVNAIIPPVSLTGPVLSIRRFGKDPLRLTDLLALQTLPPAMAEVLTGAVRARLNILVSGGTGSGKTTLLNVLSGAIPPTERIITIEDSAELHLHQEHVVRLETRPPSLEGTGVVSQRDLVRNALRMRPERIIVGEVRGSEVLDMLQAMNTGHDGSLSTIHANSTRDALTRLETMVLMAGINIPERALREWISSALDLVVQLARLSDGTRKIMTVSEIVGMEGNVITTQDIFAFDKEGINELGMVVGRHRATGIRPKFADRLRAAGIALPGDLFEDGLDAPE
ncbi:MAG: CpaF family protein [Candidatus Rokubacteria bacterium]|nr:CpaF family protein [Candidatus Rokubacteria bacterium]